MLPADATHRLHGGRTALVLENEFPGECAALDFGENAPHLRASLVGDDARTARQVTVLGGIGHRVTHVRDTALVDEIHDELHFVEALEVRHLRRIACLDQGFVASLDECRQSSAKHHLLAEQIAFRFLLEGGFDHSGAATADSRCVGQRDVLGLAARILSDGDQAGRTATLRIGGSHQMPGSLGRDHDHVQVGTRLNLLEVDIESVGEGQCRTFLDIGLDDIPVERRLMLVRCEHHDHIRCSDRLVEGNGLEAGIARLRVGGGTRTQTHGHIGPRLL